MVSSTRDRLMPDIDHCYIEDFSRALECDFACHELLEKARWPDGFVCPKCDCNRGYRLPEYGLTQCANCRYQVSATAGTIFHASHVPLKKWFLTILLITADKGGVSALRLHRLLDVSYKTALLMLRKLRTVMGKQNASQIIDCVGFGLKTILRGIDKQPVQAFFMTTEDDQWPRKICLVAKGYADYLKLEQSPQASSKSNRLLVAGAVGLVKQFFLGTYHRTSKLYLQDYLDEFAYRFNCQKPSQTLRKFIYDCLRANSSTSEA